MTETTNTPKEVQRERWNKIAESHGAVNVLRGYLRDFLFGTDVKIGKKTDEKELFDIAYGKLDAEDLEDLLESVEQDLVEKEKQAVETEKSIKQFKRRFEEENKDNIVQRYIDCIFSSYLDIRNYVKDISDDSIIYLNKDNLSRGDFNFLEGLDLKYAQQLNIEFEKLVKNINVEEIGRMEEEIKKERKRERLAQDKAQKERLVSAFVNIFDHKRKLFQEIINLLDIKNKIDVGSVGRYNKKFENFLNGFNIDDLRKISDLYSEVAKKTREMGGKEYDDEEYFLLGLEEIIKSKKVA
jgi:hypothetical protein